MMQVKEKNETIEEKKQNDWSINPNLLEQKSETTGVKKREVNRTAHPPNMVDNNLVSKNVFTSGSSSDRS